MKNRKVQKPWHDKDLNVTKWGLKQMRFLIIISSVLGFLIALCIFNL